MHGSAFLVWMSVPFVGLLLCIALCPLLPWTKHRWEHNSCKALVSAILGGGVAVTMCLTGHFHGVVHALIEYSLFMVLLFSLYTISGNIGITGDIRATPLNNVKFLAVGAVLASIIGTTGAAMVLIRPILNINRQRENVAHTVFFAIFIIANCGGLLTPIGDPPLFLGMLRGVPFFWTLELWPHWLFVNGLLLLSYWARDCKLYAQEPSYRLRADDEAAAKERIGLLGKLHVVYLIGVVACVAFLPSVDLEPKDGHAPRYIPWREMAMLSIVGLCLLTRNRKSLERNQFVWKPIGEVAALFGGIFQTMVPALILVTLVAPDLPLNSVTFFGLTGLLSAFLDNAPTYVVFFKIAQEIGGQPSVAGVMTWHLVAISTGAVFCGAMTYIGNGPNFMVKSIAETRNVKMPGFFGYILASVRFLLPVLVAMVCLLIAEGQAVKWVGSMLSAVVAMPALWWIWRHYATPVEDMIDQLAENMPAIIEPSSEFERLEADPVQG